MRDIIVQKRYQVEEKFSTQEQRGNTECMYLLKFHLALSYGRFPNLYELFVIIYDCITAHQMYI